MNLELNLKPETTVEQWRQICLDNIQLQDQVSVRLPELSFTKLRQYFTILNVILLERKALARLLPEQTWSHPPIIPPYHSEASITPPKQPLPR